MSKSLVFEALHVNYLLGFRPPNQISDDSYWNQKSTEEAEASWEGDGTVFGPQNKRPFVRYLSRNLTLVCRLTSS